MSGVLLGVDGGGSKTDFLLVDAGGRALGRARTGTTNYHQVGFDGVQSALARGVAEACEASGVALSGIRGATVGIGGVGEIEADIGPLSRAVRDALGRVPHRLVNDCEVAFAGALGLAPGVNLIAGTGSLAFARNAQGQSVRVGGWAWSIGDEGSAHWLARRLLQVFTLQSDFRWPRTALYDCVRARLGIRNDVEARFLPRDMPRRDLAELSTILRDAHAAGDETAAALWREAGAELAAHIRGVRAQIDLPDGFTASGTGGVFSLDIVRETFAAGVAEQGGLYRQPRAEPVAGAALMAAEIYMPEALGALSEPSHGDSNHRPKEMHDGI